MKKCLLLLLLFTSNLAKAQEATSIKEGNVYEILSFLASDSLKGRGNYTQQLTTAAHFIADHFKRNGLQVIP